MELAFFGNLEITNYSDCQLEILFGGKLCLFDLG